MRKDGLGKMLWLRHRWVYGLLIALAVVGALFSVTQTVGNYRMSVNYARHTATKYKNGQREFNQTKYDKAMRDQGTIFTTEYTEDTQNRVVIPYNSTTGVVTSYTMLILAALFGIAMVSWDRVGKFERFLFASPFKRQRVYWRRFFQGLAALMCATSAFYLVLFSTLFILVPAQYMNISAFGMVTLWLYNLVADSALYAAATWCALLFGNPLVSGIVGVVGFALLNSFQKAMQILFVAIRHPRGSGAYQFEFWDLPSPSIYWSLMVLLMLIVGTALALWGAPIFAKTSSEQTSRILAYPRLKWSLVVIMAVLGASVLVDGVNFSSSNLTLSLLIKTVLPGVIAGGATWLLVSFGALRRRWFNRRDARAKA